MRTLLPTLLLSALPIVSGCSTCSCDVERNRAVATTAEMIYREIWSEGAIDLVDEVFDPNYTFEVNGKREAGLDSYREHIQRYRSAMPDLSFLTQRIIAHEDTAVLHWSATGTHTGAMGAIPPTNRRAKVNGITILDFEGDKVAWGWTTWDEYGFLEQLGLLPAT